MRIGIDMSALVKEAAGIGQWIIHVTQRIMEMDSENDYYLFTYDEIKIPYQLKENWKIIYYGGEKKKQIRYLTHAPRLLKKHKIDVFIGTRHYLPPFYKKTKYIAVVHDLIPLYMPELFTRQHKLRFHLFTAIARRQANLVIAVSKATRQDVLKYMHIPEEKIRVIYEGANTMFTAVRDEAGIQSALKKYGIDSPYILCLSTVEPRKNMLRTIQAYEQVVQEHKLPYKLVIVGGSGWNNGAIYEYVQNNNRLKEHVIFTGYVSNEEVKNIYANASLFIYASLCEGFGLPVLEAMQSGVPVITSSVSSMPEVAGDACELVNPYSIDELKDAITRVLFSEETRESMRKLGLEQAKKFSWDTCAKEVLECIQTFS